MKIDLVFLILLCIVIGYIFIIYKVESMSDTTSQPVAPVVSIDQIKDAVKQVYLVDVEAIRNLSNVATQLQANGLTVPGQLKVADKISTNNLDPANVPDGWKGGLRIVDGYSSGTIGFGPDGKKINGSINSNGELRLGTWTIKENANGHLVFIKDGSKYDDGYDKIPQDTGFVAISQDGNIWSNRSTGRGWLADNKLNVSGGTIGGQLNVNGQMCVGGVCIDGTHLQMLTGARAVALKHVSGAWNNHMDMPWLHVDGNRNLTKWYDNPANWALIKN